MPWFATIDDDRYVLKYTPVHASVLAAGSLVGGSTRAALAALAVTTVLVVAALARELGLDRRSAAVAAGVFALSPLTLQLSITYLPYGTSLTLGLGAFTLALRAARTGSFRVAVVAGLVWGFAFFARPYDAVLFAVAIGISVVVTGRWTTWRVTIGGALLGSVAPLALFLAFNHAVTGDALQLPFNLLESADRLGFGRRRSLPTDGYVDFGADESIRAVGRNLLLVGAWTGGGLISVLLAGRAYWRDRAAAGPAVALAIVWTVGYALFWGSYLSAFVWDGALFLGPYYYFPLTVVISIGAAAGLRELWDSHPRLGATAAAGMIGLSAATFIPAITEQLDRSSARVEVADALADTVSAPALVFLPPLYGNYLQNPFSFLRNQPELHEGDIVYALSLGEETDARVIESFSDRRVYRLELAGGWSDKPGFDPEIEISLVDSED